MSRMLKRVITSKVESIGWLDCQINQTSPGDLDLYPYLPLHLRPQEQASLLLWKPGGGRMAQLLVGFLCIAEPLASIVALCLPPEPPLLSDHITLPKGSAAGWGDEMSTWLGNKAKQTELEPGNLQECRAAVLLSQLRTCFARGSSLCRVGGMRHVLPSRTSALQTNGKPLSHQQSRAGNGQAARVTRKLRSFLLTERGGGRTQVIIRATHSNFGEASAHGSGSSCKCCQFTICLDLDTPETQW